MPTTVIAPSPGILEIRGLKRLLVLLLLLVVLDGGVLVLLELGDEVVEVGLSLSELHLVHALAGVPVEERLSLEHSGELVGEAGPELLHGSGVAGDGGGHLEAA